MRAIFISYRREDSEGEAGRLFDDLVNQFGEASVFMDVAAIERGRDFRKAIDESVATCGILLAVIGKNWVDAKNENGERRLEDPLDFVRLETASALKRDIPVIPVLVHGATMPRPDQLSDDLKELAFRNGCELTHARWSSDLQLLIKDLGACLDLNKPAVPASVPAPIAATTQTSAWKSRGLILAAVVAVAAIAFASYRLLTPTAKPQVITSAPLTKAPVSVPSTTSSTAAAPPVAAPAPKSPQPAKVEIPSLTGMSLSAAEHALRDQHLALGSISRQPKPDAAPNTVLDEFPKSGRKVDTATVVDLILAESIKQPVPNPVPSTPLPSASVAKQGRFPDFSGTWQEFESVRNGVSTPISNAKPVTIIQNGAVITRGENGKQFQITPDGIAKRQVFFATDGQGTHDVATAAKADLVDTSTYRFEGAILVREFNYHYIARVGNHQPGSTVVIVTKMRRITPESDAPTAPPRSSK